MAEQTINYGLVKPAPDEFYDVSVPNRNMEIIDSKMKELETKKAEEQDLTTLSNTVSRITDGTAIKEMPLSNGTSTINAPVESPVNALRIDGKTIVNHPPLFDSGAWVATAPSQVVVNTPNKITFTAGTSAHSYFVKLFSLKTNTTYTVSFGGTALNVDGQIGVDIFQRKGADEPLLDGPTNNTGLFTFTTLPEMTSAWLRCIVETTARNGQSFTFENISLVEGTQAQPFVANVKGLTNPTIVNETNGTSLVVPTTLYAGEYVEQNAKGELVKYKKWQSVDMTDLTIITAGGGTAGYREIVIVQPTGIKNGNANSNLAVKFNGAVLHNRAGSNNSKADEFHTHENGNIYLAVSNTDSGWGPNYNPTMEEMKAFIAGWKMKISGQAASSMYDGTGTKAWIEIGKVSPTVANNVEVINFNTVMGNLHTPFRDYPNTKPYRLISELVTPVQEVIQPYSDLMLEKGDNTVKVYSGRIVNELAKPRAVSGDNFAYYRINNDWGSPSTSTKLLFKNSKILSVRGNNVIGSNWIIATDPNAHGTYMAYISTTVFNPAASYTVDYEPLYTWEVTAPIDSVQLQYFETLQAVTNELVNDLSKQQDTMKRMLKNAVNEGPEVLQWRSLGAQNITDGFIQVAKDKYGYVHIQFQFNDGTWYDNAILTYLPRGYRPAQILPVMGMAGNRTPFISEPFLTMTGWDGAIRMALGLRNMATGTAFTSAGISGYGMYYPIG